MLQKVLRALAVATLFVGVGFGTQLAHAGHPHDRINVDVGFSIGNLDFDLFFDRGGYGSDGLFLRVSKPYGYSDVGCSDRCYMDGGHRYHHRTCPATRRYLSSHRPRLLSRLDVFAQAFFDDLLYEDDYYRHDYYKRRKYRKYNNHRRHYRDHHRYKKHHRRHRKHHRWHHGHGDDDDDDDGGHRYKRRRHHYDDDD